MPSTIPGATPSTYESESLILHYHHLLDYLQDHASDHPFNLNRISDATAIPVRTLVFLFQTIHKTFRLFRLQHEKAIADVDREYERIERDLTDPLPTTMYEYSLSSQELLKLCDLLFLLAIIPLPFETLPAENQVLVENCPALFVIDAENRVSGSAEAVQIAEEVRKCHKLNTCLKEYSGTHIRIRIISNSSNIP